MQRMVLLIISIFILLSGCMYGNKEEVKDLNIEDIDRIFGNHNISYISISDEGNFDFNYRIYVETNNNSALLNTNELPEDFLYNFMNLKKVAFIFDYRQSDIDNLIGKNKLKELQLLSPFKDLDYSSLGELSNLESLEISSIKAEQFKLLPDMNNLKLFKYELVGDELVDYSTLPKMDKIEQISIISPDSLIFLENYPTLMSLQILFSDLEEHTELNNKMLEKIPELDKLIHLGLFGSISSLKGIEKYNNLTDFGCSETKIKTIREVAGMTKMYSITLVECELESIEPLTELYALRYVDLDYNKLTSLKGLENKKKLLEFSAEYNLITDEQEEEVVDVLLTLPHLRFFQMDTRPELNERYVASGIGALNIDEQLYNSTS